MRALVPKAGPCSEGVIRSVQTDTRCADTQKTWILAATILGSSMAFIDESVVNVALPAVEADLKVSVSAIQWLINAYTLCVASLLLIGGACGDRFGRRRTFVAGIAIFSAASVGCGLAQTVNQLLLMRAIQGVGAALMIPCSLAIIGAAFSEAERGKAIGTWAGVSAIAAAAGPVLGGWIVDQVSWRWIFLINPLLAVATAWIALRHVPESRDPDASPGLDWPGAVLVFAGLGSIVFGLIDSSTQGWRDPLVTGAVAGGLALLGAFVWVEGRSRAAMMPLDLFRSRTFSAVNALTLLLYGALGGAFFFLPFDLIQVHGYSATAAGAMFLPFTIIIGVLSRWSGALLDRIGARPSLIAGPLIVAAGFVLLASPDAAGPQQATFLLAMTILGLGMAICVAPLTTTVINAVPSHRTGVASGINNAVASIAGLLAVAILGAVALATYDAALDRRLAAESLSAEARQVVQAAHGSFVLNSSRASLGGEERAAAAAIVRQSLADAVRLALLAAAGLALAGAACSALAIRSATRVAPAQQGEKKAR